MAVSPHAAPLSRPAQPDLTGGRSIGVLLSHGFTGSPFSMRPWGEHLAELGYAVEVPRLPGHGTTWREMNQTTWNDWYGEISRAYAKLSAENDAVVACGLSMGGALVLRLAADHPDGLAGIVVVNPAVRTLRKDVLALPVLKHLVPAFPAIANDIKKPGMDEHAYPKTPLKAAHSMMSAWRPLVGDLGRITAPMLYFRSTVDHVVDESSEPLIVEGVSSEVTMRRLDNSFHVATLDNDAETIFAESAEFIAKVTAGS
ncbi:MAG: alpha/beta fold hydrolase [Nocardioides sp.]|uniref:alpha/beta hydrolase n=1 Tax=Nocardioides sp. TaxID=35761 RepID=UPI0039E38051